MCPTASGRIEHTLCLRVLAQNPPVLTPIGRIVQRKQTSMLLRVIGSVKIQLDAENGRCFLSGSDLSWEQQYKWYCVSQGSALILKNHISPRIRRSESLRLVDFEVDKKAECQPVPTLSPQQHGPHSLAQILYPTHHKATFRFRRAGQRRWLNLRKPSLKRRAATGNPGPCMHLCAMCEPHSSRFFFPQR